MSQSLVTCALSLDDLYGFHSEQTYSFSEKGKRLHSGRGMIPFISLYLDAQTSALEMDMCMELVRRLASNEGYIIKVDGSGTKVISVEGPMYYYMSRTRGGLVDENM